MTASDFPSPCPLEGDDGRKDARALAVIDARPRSSRRRQTRFSLLPHFTIFEEAPPSARPMRDKTLSSR